MNLPKRIRYKGQIYEAVNTHRHKISIRESETSDDFYDDFISTFDPDGDPESGFMAHSKNELRKMTAWLDEHEVDYDWDYEDRDSDYYAYIEVPEWC